MLSAFTFFGKRKERLKLPVLNSFVCIFFLLHFCFGFCRSIGQGQNSILYLNGELFFNQSRSCYFQVYMYRPTPSH